MRLYIVRHAWAEEPDEKWGSDAARPLTDEGKKRYRKVVEALVERGFAPRVIATSPYLRTKQTAEIAAKLLPTRPDVVELPALACGSSLEGALEWTFGRDEDEIAWVGHMPDVSLLAGALVGATDESFDFAKAATAAIDFDGPPARRAGTLRWFVTAKMLGV
jgi:phosphohistidine phosphatase